MNIVFIHNNFPAQFKHLATFFAKDSNNKVLFLVDNIRADINIPGVTILHVKPNKKIFPDNGEGLQHELILQKNVNSSKRYAKVLYKIRKEGFIPDIIYGHPGWGLELFVQDIFPESLYVCFFEWYYTKEADYTFVTRGKTRPPSDFINGRLRNLCQLNALANCDVGFTPTKFQQKQYPQIFHSKLNVLHDGIDIDYFSPKKNEKFKISQLDLSGAKEILTYATRGLEPYRGFPQFYHSLPKVLAARPDCHVVIVGNDQVNYGAKPKDGIGFREKLCNSLPLEWSRVHFLDFLPYDDYRSLLRASSVHVYLTMPFVLSWSMLEAMSCGCLLVASETEPVCEIAKNNKNALLTDFWDHNKISETIIYALSNKKKLTSLQKAARNKITQEYDLKKVLPKCLSILLNALEAKKISNKRDLGVR